MDTMQTRNQLEMARNANDLGSLNSLREAIANGEDEQALQETAQQFEAIFVQMMLKSMRKAQDALADENSPFNSEQVKFYRDMHDQQLAVDLTSNGGMGLADIIVKQLGQNNPDYTPASAIRADGNLSSINLQVKQQVASAQESVLASASKGTPSAYKAPLFESREAFVEALYPHAENAAREIGADPKAIIAQAAVETGWGQYVIHDGEGTPSYNLFGIKANHQWQGKQAVVDTVEYSQGIASKQKAGFRAYDSIEASINDYVDFIRSGARYQQAVDNSHNPQAYYQSLQQAGYATDPAYADKLMAVYQGSTLSQYNP